MTTRRPPRIRLLGLVLLLAASGCGADDASGLEPSPKSDAGSAGQPCLGANDCEKGQVCNAFGLCAWPPPSGDGGVDAPPPEKERVPEPPAIGKRYVYAAVPAEDLVARIDSQTLKVQSINVGSDPGALRTIAGQDVAVVLNRGDATASILRVQSDGSDAITTLPTIEGANRLHIAPDGRHAVVRVDLEGASGIGATLQEVTVLGLQSGQERAVDLAVGFRPLDVQFSQDGAQAFVISEGSISVIALATVKGGALLPTVALRTDPLTESPPEEVQVTADGKLALARLPQRALLRTIDLTSKAITDLVLPAVPTDIDLQPDGKQALVVLRDSQQLALIDLSDAQVLPADVTLLALPQPAGQVVLTPDGKTAFLFSNALETKILQRLDLASRTLTALALQKGVREVHAAPDGKTVLVVHNKQPGEAKLSDPLDVYIDRRHGYSLVDLDSGFVKLQLTDAAPGPVAFASDGSSAYLTLSDPMAGVRALDAIDLRGFLVHQSGLGSPPVAVGVVPATGQVYVAQSHPLGRVTFIDTKTGKRRTLTGFALDSQVIE